MIYSAIKFNYILIEANCEDSRKLNDLMGNFSHYCCVGIARNKSEAINLILEESPQLVFLNIETVFDNFKSTQFEIIHELYQYLTTLPEFIVISNTTKFAYHALKNGVTDYLLKPYNSFEFKKTLLQFEKKQPNLTSICLKSFTEYKYLLVNNIVYLKADNNTTDFFLKDGTMATSSSTLKNFELQLPNIFVRIHKSYIVNINYITKIHFSKFQCFIKHSTKHIPFSKGLKSKMHEIKNSWINGPLDVHHVINLA